MPISDPSFTFVPAKTLIDHVLVEEVIVQNIQNVKILPETEVITSDHLPILASFKLQTGVDKKSEPKSNVAWHKCSEHQLNEYCLILEHELSLHLQNGDIHTPEYINQTVVNAIRKAEQSLPKSKYNPNTKPYWTEEIKLAHSDSRRLRRIWIYDGRPRGNEFNTYKNYKTAKSKFRKLQRIAANNYLKQSIDELERASETDYRLFWKLLRKRKNKPNCNCTAN